jgi:hypothetical protein
MKFKTKNKFFIPIAILIAGLIFIHIWFFLTDTYNGRKLEAENAAQFGDFIGGYVGTIFALTSILLLYITLRSQIDLAKKDKFESKFFELLKLHRDNVSEIGIGEKYGKRTFVLMIREFREIFNIIIKVCNESKSKLSIEEKLNLSYIAFYYGVGPNSTRILNDSLSSFDKNIIDKIIPILENKDIAKEIMERRGFEFTPFEGHQSRLGHYFRHLYSTVKYVDNRDMSEPEKYTYLKFLRAQLSNHEQALLFLNSISYLGKKWKEKGLISKYRFIKNIPKSFFSESSEVDIKSIYPNIKFEWEEVLESSLKHIPNSKN